MDVSPVVDLGARSGRGPLWGIASGDLNATLLEWPEGDGVPEHVNDGRDVLLVVLDGTGRLTLDGADHPLRRHTAVLLPKGVGRRIEAGPGGIRYLTMHLRRDGLAIDPAPG
jgi:quercetin dioxygenase-like cupin family protein